MPENSQVNYLLSNWQQWPLPEKPRLIKKFTQGLNHLTYLITSADHQYVLKCFTTAQARTIQAQLWATNLSVAPNILFVDEQHRYILMDYVNCTRPDVGYIEKIAQTLKRLHSATCADIADVTGSFHLLGFCDEYLMAAGSRAALLHKQLMPALTSFINDATEQCLCHNDLVAENCCASENCVCLLDWEYAQINNPWFDLASVIVYQSLDADQANIFLEAYQTGLSEQSTSPIFYTSQIAVLWTDILWYLSRFGENYWPMLAGKYEALKQAALAINLTVD